MKDNDENKKAWATQDDYEDFVFKKVMQIYYEKEGIPYKYIEMDNKITNPVQLTFRILQDIKDKNSKVFKKLFE